MTVVVPSQVSKKAVRRNRIKRLARETFRLNLPRLPLGWWLIKPKQAQLKWLMKNGNNSGQKLLNWLQKILLAPFLLFISLWQKTLSLRPWAGERYIILMAPADISNLFRIFQSVFVRLGFQGFVAVCQTRRALPSMVRRRPGFTTQAKYRSEEKRGARQIIYLIFLFFISNLVSPILTTVFIWIFLPSSSHNHCLTYWQRCIIPFGDLGVAIFF